MIKINNEMYIIYNFDKMLIILKDINVNEQKSSVMIYENKKNLSNQQIEKIVNKKPSLKCTGTKLTEFKDETDMYVGTLTADEMSFAGATGSTNYNYYLIFNLKYSYISTIAIVSSSQ